MIQDITFHPTELILGFFLFHKFSNLLPPPPAQVDELMRQELSNLKLAVEKGGRKKKAARKRG